MGEKPRRLWDRAFLDYIKNSVLRTCACAAELPGTDKNIGTSTSRRGARVAYHDEYPRDFDPQIAYTVSLVSDTSRPPIRQGGRETAAPRPCETNPFRPPALFTPNTKINLYIYTNLFPLFLPRGNCIVSRNISAIYTGENKTRLT